MRLFRDCRRRFDALGNDDAGFILPFILLVTMMIVIGTGTMLTVVANNAVPARHSQDQQAALAAAQAGVQAYIAEMNANCSSYSIGTCVFPCAMHSGSSTTCPSGSAQSGSTPTTMCPSSSGTSPAYSPSAAPSNSRFVQSWCPDTPNTWTTTGPAVTGGAYSAYATNPTGFLTTTNDDLRIMSTGCVQSCSSSTATVRLLADVSGTPSALRFTYFTNVESVDGNLLSSLYPAGRTIKLDGPTAKLVGATGTVAQTLGGSVTWPGVTTSSTCNQTWAGGRSTGSNDTVSETATTVPTGVTGQYDHACSVSFSKGMKFVGPVYSGDQLYLSNGTPGASTGPDFSVPTACSVTAPAVTTNCEPLAPASSPASPAYRSVTAPLGGSPATAGSVTTSPISLSLPTSVSDATASCTATGTNVAISFSGTTATITGGTGCPSPLTVAGQTIKVVGNASVQGSLAANAGQVSVVAAPSSAGVGGSIYITGDVKTTGTTTTNQFNENAYGTGSAIALVATNDVVLQHDVSCASTLPTGTSTGFCANDISGLYTTNQSNEVVNADGTLKSTHPARQYCNATANTYPCGGTASTCDSPTPTPANPAREVDAAIFALNGSFRTDNFNRGCALGQLQVVGGIYQNHRGPLGQEWETPTASTTRAFSGYKLQLTYESLQYAGLPYVPALRGGTPNHPWLVISVSTPTGGGS